MQEQQYERSVFDFNIDLSRGRLSKLRRWSSLLAVCGYILAGIFVCCGAFLMMAKLPGDMRAGAFFYWIFGAICLYPSYEIHTFSVMTRKALVKNDQHLLNQGFDHLQRLFSFLGILAICAVIIFSLFGLVVLYNSFF